MPTKLTVTTFGSWQRNRATDHLFRGNLKRSLKPPIRLPPSHGYNAVPSMAFPPSMDTFTHHCYFIKLIELYLSTSYTDYYWLTNCKVDYFLVSERDQPLIGNQPISNWCNVSLPFITNNKLDHFPMIIIISYHSLLSDTIAVCIWHTFHIIIIMMIKYHKLSWPDNISYWNEFLDHRSDDPSIISSFQMIFSIISSLRWSSYCIITFRWSFYHH